MVRTQSNEKPSPSSNSASGPEIVLPPAQPTPGATRKSETVKEQSTVTAVKRSPLPDWSNCVEGTVPQFAKLRKLVPGDFSPGDLQKITMCLKCGQLPESTWAIDKLNILLGDERASAYFSLSQHQSLLDPLVEHFRRSLKEIFGSVFNSVTEYEGEHVPDTSASDCMITGNNPSQLDVHHNTKTVAESTSVELPNMADLPPPGAHVPMDPDLLLQDPTSDGRSDDANSIGHIDMDFSLRHCNFPSPKNTVSNLDVIREKMLMAGHCHSIDETHPFSFNRLRQRRIDSSSVSDGVPSPSTTQECCVCCERLSSTTLQEESEACDEEECVLWSIPPEKEPLQYRCLCLANILRNLSFVPGNDCEFSKHPGVLRILGVLLLLHHIHVVHVKKQQLSKDKKSNEEEDSLQSADDETDVLFGPDYWWWGCLKSLRETVFIILANISGQLDLSIHSEYVVLPVLSGLLHWTVCPSTQASDYLSSHANALFLTPQRLVLEALAKLSILDTNVDYILATPPLARFQILYSYLVKMLGNKEQPVIRQFALVLLSNLAQGDDGASYMIGGEKMVVSHLVECLENSESLKRRKALPQPMYEEEMSITMLRRAAVTLHCLSKIAYNRKLFTPSMDRLLYLSTSDHLDPSVSSVVLDILFELGKRQLLLS